MKRIEIFGYLFSAIALGVFVLALFSEEADPLRSQAIYWFLIAIACLVLPDLKKFKFKDMEIELRENIKRVEEKIDNLSDTFFNSLDKVWREESEMPSFLKEKRNKHWAEFQSYLESLPDKERLEAQIANTFKYLSEYNIGVSQLKEMLKALGFYRGAIDNNLSEETIQAIIQFQKSNNLSHIDGIFGPLSFQKMKELVDIGEVTNGNA
jgi:BMFP domain-containing protein YqiC